jgi:hypothetical protein
MSGRYTPPPKSSTHQTSPVKLQVKGVASQVLISPGANSQAVVSRMPTPEAVPLVLVQLLQLPVPAVGAYCLSMAANYNLAPRPAVVLVNEGKARLIQRRETYLDLMARDLPLST